MEKICLYTCITGNYDNIHEIEKKEKGIDYYLFTNNKNIKSKTWKVIYIEDEKLDNQRLSRKIKMLGHEAINNKYDISVWQDASVIFKKSVREFVNTYLKENNFATFKHYMRDCIYEEANECIRVKKDKKETILKHIEFLRKEGYPEHNGLCEMTVFVKRHNDPVVKKTMEDWFNMVCKYSKRDQLSFMYCVWKNDLKLDLINLSVWDNTWFINKKHNVKEKLTTARIYYGTGDKFDPKLDDQVEYQIEGNTYSFKSKVLEDTNVIEIELTDVPVIEYKNLKIKGIKYDKIEYFNTINFENKNVFYNTSGIIKLTGNFKKGREYVLSIELNKLEGIDLYSFIEKKCIDNITKNSDNEFLKEEINKITNSTSWKITKPLRRFR